jgi:hypothetical protein
MYSFLTRNGQVLAFGLGLLLIVIFLLIAISGAGDYNFEGMSVADIKGVTIFDFGLYAAIALVVIAIAAMLIFSVLQFVDNPKAALKGVLGLVAVVLVFIIAYSLANSEPGNARIAASIRNFEEAGNGVIGPGTLKFIGGGIITALIMSVSAAVLLLVTGVRSLLK